MIARSSVDSATVPVRLTMASAWVLSCLQSHPVWVSAAEPLSPVVSVEIFGGQFLAENVAAVRQHAATLESEQRFEFLAEWVLPGRRHPGFRLSGEFSTTRPASGASLRSGVDSLGGDLVSPVFDLIDLAVETGQLTELRDQVTAIEQSPVSYQHRSRAALLLLLSLELNDRAAADSAFEALFAEASQVVPQSMAEQWPETLVAARCVERFPDFEPLNDLLGVLMTQRVLKQKPAGHADWFVFLSSLARRHEAFERIRNSDRASDDRRVVQPLRNWVHVSRERHDSCGRGLPVASWQWDGVDCRHLNGHTEDYLFYRSPLRGEFSVEGDVLGYSTTQFLITGELFGPGKPSELITGVFRTGSRTQPINPKLHSTDRWIRLRTDIRDGVNRVWVNGRLVHSREVPEDFEPWVALRAWSRAPGAVRDLRISGKPQVLESVELSSPGCLAGWYPYYDEPVGTDEGPWQTPIDASDGAQIIGIRRGLPGFTLESLLRYHRPLIEDGSIEYEFYYTPGEAMTHPTLGRRTFLLQREGVQQHWVTDGRFDRTSLRPDNTSAIGNATQIKPLPLKPDAWNAMQMSLVDATVRLTLNGERILETQLGETNTRHFGLFHFAEQSEVRVRNVVMRGNWPRTLPDVARQQLADPVPGAFDARLAELAPVFDHDFGRDGLSEEYFESTGGFGLATTSLTPQGLQHRQRSDGQYRYLNFSTWLRMQGDFDVTADFDDLQLSEAQLCGAELFVTLEGGIVLAAKRRWQAPNHHRLAVEWALPPEEGTSTAEAGEMRRIWEYISTEASSGRLRIARRGDSLCFLFAENDSSEFRVVASTSFKSLGARTAQTRLAVVANKGGTTSVTWKKLRIAADELLILPDPRNPPKPLLCVMNADGTGLRPVTQQPEDPEITGYASADWSPDGQWLAFDGWTGRSETTHSYLIKSDGTGFRDLGPGLMPTFSPDGNRLAFTWALNGMATMDLNGQDREVVSPDGWGAQWSPDGQWISYESRGRVNGSYSANITIIDPKTKQKRQLLEGDLASRYSQIYWNAAWSPDSRQIAFKGNVKGGDTEIAITSVGGSSKGFRVVSTETFDPEMAWHPDGKQLMLARVSKPHSGSRLFVYDLVKSELSLLETQPMDRINTHGVWSPDGTQIVFSSRHLPGPIPWQPKNPAQ